MDIKPILKKIIPHNLHNALSSIYHSLIKGLRNGMPYGIVANQESRNLYDLMNKFNTFDLNLYKPESNIIDQFTVHAVHGTGGSGSGAMMDFMREIDGNTCLGSSQIWAKDKKKGIPIEFDILRLAGGLLELEKLCEIRNYFIADELIHDCVDLFNFNLLNIKPYISDDNFTRLENAILYFMHQQIAFIIEGDHMIMNYHLHYSRRQISKRYRAYWPQSISREMYIYEVQRLLSVFFSVFFENNRQITLVHPFADTGLRLEQMKVYIPNLKLIIVTRNDCDVYVQGTLLHWNMWFNVDQYIKRKDYLNQATVIPDGLHVAFEDLVCNYEETRKRILEYLEIPEEKHHPKTIFDPSISIQNVNLYKNHPEFADDCNKIKKALNC